MFTQIKNPNFYLLMGSDMLLFGLAHFFAYCMRFEFHLMGHDCWYQMEFMLPFVIILKTTVFMASGLYRGMWRYFSLEDLWNLFKAVMCSSLLILSGILILQRFEGFSRAVFILDGGLTFLFTGGLRFTIRMLYQRRVLGREEHEPFSVWQGRKGKNTLIYGAGNSGEKTLREIMDNPGLPYRVVGFMDDDPDKHGRTIHGVRVYGSLESLPSAVKNYRVEEVLIAIPTIVGDRMRRIVDVLEKCGVRYRTLPALGELIDGKVSIKALRDVDYRDLLGRPPVELDTEGIGEYLTGKTVLITGAGGSIGSELCRQIVRFKPREMVLLDSSEENLYNIQMELKHRLSYFRNSTVLAKVQHQKLMDAVFSRFKPQVLFHAAAYKHVPMLEMNPWEAYFNNIIGTKMVLEHSLAHGVDRFVLVSTDKAVRPTNVMGTSKRVAELVLQSYIGNGTRMMAVRFGNVIGSSGSVVPLFRSQIASGGPVTVTHPEMTRYFMTIPEASQLILQAGALGEGGEIFILEMGTPVKIADMARDLILLSGKEPGRDITILFTGTRPGEKLYEELITEGEGIVSTDHERIMVLKMNGTGNGHCDQKIFRRWLFTRLEELNDLAGTHDSAAIRKKLHEIVPEYTPGDGECVLGKSEWS